MGVITETEVAALNGRFAGKDPGEAVSWALERFHATVALACSFSREDIVLAHLMRAVDGGARIFALDTGRLNEETYEVAEKLRLKLGAGIEWHFPDRRAVEQIERAKGLYSFRESLEDRHECCHVRKVEPLNRALNGLGAWVTGQRRAQALTRTSLDVVEIDRGHGGILKLNPLAFWSDDDVAKYVAAHGLPENRLHAQGYPSIGCAPCTRAVGPCDDPRAGRWWWENPEHKECGLHAGNRGPR